MKPLSPKASSPSVARLGTTSMKPHSLKAFSPMVVWLCVAATFALAACAHSAASPARQPPPPAGTVAVVVPAAPPPSPPWAPGLPKDIEAEPDTILHISSADPMLGAADALVTMVVISDLQCPFCAKHATTVKELRRRYPPDVLRVVWKNNPLPFHPQALPAAQAAMAVFALGGSEAFFCFADTLFENQEQLGPSFYPRAAARCGVNPNAMQADITGGNPTRKIAADMRLATALEANGTPTSVVNGIRVEGAQPLAMFAAAIDREIEEARKALAAGAPRNRAYAQRVLVNYKQPEASESAETSPPADTTVYNVPVGNSPMIGSARAPVTIVMFADFQCPFCKRAAATLTELRAKYGDKVRIVFKNVPLPFHNRAEPTAQLALEARAQQGDTGFWRAHDELFRSAPKLEDGDLEVIALKLRLDPARVRSALTTHRHQHAVDADLALARQLHVEGTPMAFINGRAIVGAQPIGQFEQLVDQGLKDAQALIGRGVPPSRVYDELVRKGASSLSSP